MKILSIETSCDDTGIAILEAKNNTFKILAEEVSSQIDIHAEFGGVFPALAKREHIKNLPIVLEKVLKKAKIKSAVSVDFIAVTVGPGLEPALWTGIVFAKELAEKWNVPIIPVNHMEGHVISVFADTKKSFKIPKVKFPALSLLVSGGHTELVLLKDWMKYTIIGETCDDAAGEAFDKVARMLGLPYPGGPQISKLAEIGRNKEKNSSITLPRPMMYSKNYDFSFSGLKTAVLYMLQKLEKLNEDMKIKIAREFEDAAVEVLTHKTLKAIHEYKIKTLIVAGGVSANKRLQKILKQKINKENKISKSKIEVLFPNKKLETDNAVMISLVGYFNQKKAIKKGFDKIKAIGNLSIGKIS